MSEVDPLLAAVEARRRRLRCALEDVVPMPSGQRLYVSETQAAQLDIVIDEIADRVMARINNQEETR